MEREFYIAGCVFTTKHPALSTAIRHYVQGRFRIHTVRCCVPNYKLKEFAEKLPPEYREDWQALPDSGDFAPGDTVYSLCHNCSAILEETKPAVKVKSLWELILSDEAFPYPDYHGLPVTVQDCWRAKDRAEEQAAVRQLLKRMNLKVSERSDAFAETDFCGISLYRPAPPRNLKLAPKRFVENAAGKFLPHTSEEQLDLMQKHCAQFKTEHVVAYCHYCEEGLLAGKKNAAHLAALLFPQYGNFKH